MWIAVITSHMALIDPYLIKPAMDAITDGWNAGRSARNIQFVKFELMYDVPLAEIRAAYHLRGAPVAEMLTARERAPELLQA